MAINFPDSPSNGDTHTVGGQSFVYDVAKNKWKNTTAVPAITSDGATPSLASGITDAEVKTLLNISAGVAVTAYANLAAFPSSGNTVGDFGFANDTKGLYVWDGTEWDRVYTGIETAPTWTTQLDTANGYTLNSDGTASNITVAASDPEGFPITYSHTTNPSNQTQATITNSGGTFTITPSTNTANAGNFDLRVAATDGLRSITSTANMLLQFVPEWTTYFQTMADDWSPHNVLLRNYGGIANAQGQTWYRSGGISVSRDGTKMTISDQTGSGRPVDFTMSTPFDPSSLAFAQIGDTNIWAKYALEFSEDGTKIFYGDQTSVKYATLSTAFNTNTRSGLTDVVYAGGGTIYDITFSTDGMKMFVLAGDQTGDNRLLTYTLTAPWETSGLTLSHTFYFWASYTNNNARQVSSAKFNPTGTVLYIVSAHSGNTSNIPLTTAFDMSTAGAVSADGSLGAGSNIQKAVPSWDGNWVYALRDQQDNNPKLYWKQKP